ncbi:GntR family transcriptional regulator [Salinivibrio kushneri]|uniref:GntR family transcriptional regulator n=1 Tax=Salinivibrio kushneri TaxID=1908198 RepID=UPI000985BA77|nr:GntR family transcriptional regulator [Salinivibrio kushneri]OOE62813.1 hypothetical protein BZG18_02010 [Salinivibrio kushneri]
MMQFMAIRQQLLAQIDRGLLAPDKKLPGERQLADTFSTTRVTLREALAVLEAEGRIYRRERRGWFVAPTPCAYDPSQLVDWQHDFSQHGGQFAWLAQKTPMASAEVSDQMQLPPFAQVFEGEGLIQIAQLPVGFVRTFLHPDYFPSVWQTGDQATLLNTPANADVSWSSAWEALDSERASVLAVPAGTPVLTVTRAWRIQPAQGSQTIRIDTEWWRQHAVTLCGGSARDAQAGSVKKRE